MSHSHSHAHVHNHPQHHGGDDTQAAFAQAHADHYDAERAKQYDSSPIFHKYGKNLAEALSGLYPFNKNTTVLDFACGTGLVSRELAPHVKSILGVDVSPAAVEVFNTRATETGSGSLRAICKLLKGDEAELEGEKFDVVLCTMAYHHLPDILGTTRILASHLKSAGTLIVVDALPTETGNAPETEVPRVDNLEIEQVVIERAKRGFTRELIQQTFENSGMGEGFRYVGPAMKAIVFPKEGEEGWDTIPKEMLGVTMRLFAATGTKKGERSG